MFSLVPKKKRSILPVSMFDDMDRIFNGLWVDFSELFCDCHYKDDDGNIIYEMEVPGFSKDTLKIEVSDGVLTMKGERKEDCKESKCQNKIHKQIVIGDLEAIRATIKDGILKVTFKTPKEPEKEVTSIEVK